MGFNEISTEVLLWRNHPENARFAEIVADLEAAGATVFARFWVLTVK